MSKVTAHIRYKNKDGTIVPGVTTILSILAKPQLITWANQMGLRGIDSTKYRDEMGDIGTLAHMMIYADFKDEKPDTSEYSAQDIEKAETCLIKYWEWAKGHKIEPILLEAPLISEEYHFGGTIDFYGNVDEQPTLLDFKTGKAIYPEFFYQLAAYEKLLAEANQPLEKTRILRIGRNEDEGFEEQVIGLLAKQWQIFLNCLSIYNLQKEIRR